LVGILGVKLSEVGNDVVVELLDETRALEEIFETVPRRPIFPLFIRN
jgi:hypothetical protein